MSSRLLLRKLRVLLRLRRTRFSELSLSLDKSRLRLTEELLRRKRSSTTLARTTDVQWNPSRPPLSLSSAPRLRLLESRRSSSLTSTSTRLLWTTPTRQTTRLSSPSRDTRVSSVRLNANNEALKSIKRYQGQLR